MKIAHYAEVYGILIAPHNPYGPVALAAAAHAAAAMPNFTLLEHCRLRPWFEDVQKVAVPIVRGYVDLDELGETAGAGSGAGHGDDQESSPQAAGLQPLRHEGRVVATGLMALFSLGAIDAVQNNLHST